MVASIVNSDNDRLRNGKLRRRYKYSPKSRCDANHAIDHFRMIFRIICGRSSIDIVATRTSFRQEQLIKAARFSLFLLLLLFLFLAFFISRQIVRPRPRTRSLPDSPDMLTYVWLSKNTEYRKTQRLKRNRTERCNFDERDAKAINKLTVSARFRDTICSELTQNANYTFETNFRKLGSKTKKSIHISY